MRERMASTKTAIVEWALPGSNRNETCSLRCARLVGLEPGSKSLRSSHTFVAEAMGPAGFEPATTRCPIPSPEAAGSMSRAL